MRILKTAAATIALSVSVSALITQDCAAQDRLPETDDAVVGDYHTSPRYRESESHPLRVLAYVVHPVGWALRELIFRPLSYFAGSTPETKSIMGYREPYDFRTPSCFNADQPVPDCHKLSPFDYNKPVDDDVMAPSASKIVYFPDVNFDFDKRSLNKRGKQRAQEVAAMLKKEGSTDVVLEGNTDNRGTDDYNMKLGMDRANAVKAELVKLGIPGGSLKTVSFGETRPLFTENEDWAYAANRRVAVRFDGTVAALPQQ